MFYLALIATGFTSAFNCVALQMGLLGSTIATKKGPRSTLIATTTFLSSKFFAYVLVGFFLGLFGRGIAISEEVSSYIEILAGIYIILAALNILGVHPLLRYTVLQPPRFVLRFVKNQSKSNDIFAPAILGFLTILIPCGTTVAVETLALSTGNPFAGGLVLGAFTLGTMPVFIGYGTLSAFLGDKVKRRFDQISAIIILALGVYALASTLYELGFTLPIFFLFSQRLHVFLM